jgi:ADP-heptose:LPS heptosyltransferase
MGKTFLIGQLERFGDCLYATTLAKQIKHDNPDCHIIWAVGAKYKSILDLNPHIDEIWEIPDGNSNYDGIVWNDFETEALKRQATGEFDEIIFSQIAPRNWIKYTGTIRGTILSSYHKPITVSIEPVVKLSEKEVENVKTFAEKHHLKDFEKVVLFECEPGSEQSKINTEFALEVVQNLVEQNKNICFILSTAQKLSSANANILDASELTFRENAELTHYCHLLIGCSSGITWLSTSDWAKKLPTIQLLNSQLLIFAGLHFDFEVNHLDTSQIIEMTEFDVQNVIDCVKSVIENGVEKTKKNYHQIYKPSFFDLRNIAVGLIYERKSPREIVKFVRNYVRINKTAGNKISAKYLLLIPYIYFYSFFYRHIKTAETGIFFELRKFAKSIFKVS